MSEWLPEDGVCTCCDAERAMGAALAVRERGALNTLRDTCGGVIHIPHSVLHDVPPGVLQALEHDIRDYVEAHSGFEVLAYEDWANNQLVISWSHPSHDKERSDGNV